MSRPAYGYTPRPAGDPHRGVAYRGPRATPPPPNVTIDLRSLAPPMRDQASQGACTGFAGRGAVCGLIEAARRDGLWEGEAIDPAPGAIYAEELYLDGALGRDQGASIARLVDVLATRGIPREDRAPYDLRDFTRRAPEACWSGRRLVNVTPLRHDLEDLRAAFADGCPVVAGIPCYTGARGLAGDAAFASGAVALPTTDDALDGWHAVSLWGHDPYTRPELGGLCWVQNSWAGWAPRTGGMGTIPAHYLVGLANELYAFGAVR
ncbi:MAG: peptidase [Myxococcaceae bacterium]|nr:peptidase [Myxococcaceae bacterium]